MDQVVEGHRRKLFDNDGLFQEKRVSLVTLSNFSEFRH